MKRSQICLCALALMLAVFAGGCVSAEQNAAEWEAFVAAHPTTNLPPAPDRDAAIIQARACLEISLKDAESARYRWGDIVRGYRFGARQEYGWVLRAQINAKNSYGAYTGYKFHYIFFTGTDVIDITTEVDNRRAGVL